MIIDVLVSNPSSPLGMLVIYILVTIKNVGSPVKGCQVGALSNVWLPCDECQLCSELYGMVMRNVVQV